jgi:hypothetical protein
LEVLDRNLLFGHDGLDDVSDRDDTDELLALADERWRMRAPRKRNFLYL